MELLHFVPLHDEQHRACTKFVNNGGRGIAWHKVGQGKTRIGLTVVATLQQLREWKPPCILVVVCRRRAFHTWRNEIEECQLGYFVQEWNPKGPMDFEDAMPTVWLVSIDQVKHLRRNPYIRAVIIDELHMFKNPKSDRSKAAQMLAARYPTTGLSGSIMTASNISDVYGQAMAVGLHKTISPTWTQFRTEYMMSINMGGKFPTTCARRGAYNKIMSKLSPYVDVFWPEKNERRIHESILKVPITPEQRALYKELKDTWEIDNIEINNALTIGIKTQQISDGWVKLKEKVGLDLDGRDVHREWVREVPANKVEYLIGLMEEIIESGNKCIVWCAFKEDITYLAPRLPFATLQMSGDEPLDVKAWASGKFDAVVATQGSGSSINDFAQVPYGIYYSQSFKWTDLQQSQGRHDRKSSQHSDCYFYYLHTQGSLDKHIYDTVKESQGLEKALIDKGELAQWLKQQ